MGFLSGKPKIEGDERDQCLAYLEEETKLLLFQGTEEKLYNEALEEYGKWAPVDSRAGKEMRQAAGRLVQAAKEIVRRRDGIGTVPDIASATYSAWQKSYPAFLQYAAAEVTAWEADAKGKKPDRDKLRKLSSQSRELQRKAAEEQREAIGEQRKLVKLLKLGGDVMQKMLDDASAAIENDNWQPEELVGEAE